MPVPSQSGQDRGRCIPMIFLSAWCAGRFSKVFHGRSLSPHPPT